MRARAGALRHAGRGPGGGGEAQRAAAAPKKFQFRCISIGYGEKTEEKQGENRPIPGRKQGKNRANRHPETTCRRAAFSIPLGSAWMRTGAAPSPAWHPMRRRICNLRLQKTSSWESPVRATKNPAGGPPRGSNSHPSRMTYSNTRHPPCQAKNWGGDVRVYVSVGELRSGWKWGEGYRQLGRKALTEILEGRMAEAVGPPTLAFIPHPPRPPVRSVRRSAGNRRR